jgi:hypothetical protein
MGKCPGKGWEIGRKENDGDYEPENCEWQTRSLQVANKRFPTNVVTGFRGVYPRKSGKFMAVGAGVYLGTFNTVESAARAVDWKARQVYGETYSYFNFKDGMAFDRRTLPRILRVDLTNRGKSIVGKKYGSLTVIEDNGTTYAWFGKADKRYKVRTVKVRCRCTKVLFVRRASVITGSLKSCGRECPLTPTGQSLVGKKYGLLTVIEDGGTHAECGENGKSYRVCTVKVKCECGTVKYVRRNIIMGGHQKSCGRHCPLAVRRR